MKKIVTLLIILFLTSVSIHAQKSLFRMYRFECSELYNIDIKKPKGFKVIDGITPFRVNEKKRIGMFYRMTLESKTKDCLILFPYFNNTDVRDIAARNMFYGEVKAALNLNPDNETLVLDSVKYLKIIAKDDMDDCFNADTVFIYKVPLPKPYKEIYSQCIGINVIKKGYPSAMIKILLTEDANKKDEEYIQTFLSSIHYDDSIPEVTQKKVAHTLKKMKRRFVFRMKGYMYPGYIGYSDELRK